MKTILKTTEWTPLLKEYVKTRIRATYGLHYLKGNSSAYFSLTGDIQEVQNGYWKDAGGGCLHEEICKNFPDLEEYVKWHLTGWDGPMHYYANAAYWWMKYFQACGKIPLYEDPGSSLNTQIYRLEKEETPEKLLKYFKSTTVFGALSNDKFPDFSVPYRTQRVGSEVKEVPMCEPRKLIEEKIADWCFERKEKLMKLFKSDMVKLLGEEVLSEESTESVQGSKK